MDEPREKEHVKMFYRLVKDGNDVELHQEIVFRFSPEQVKHLIRFLLEAEKHFLTIEYVPMSKRKDGFPQVIYITKERSLKLLELLKAISKKT